MATMLISVVIPSFNHQRFLPMAVESVLNQTHQQLELIIVDDGSTDESRQYLNTISDSRCTVILQENAGAHAAINRGLATAQGDILAILNSDDVYHRKRLQKAAKSIQQKKADLVSSWIALIDEKGRVGGIKRSWRNMPPWELPSSGPRLCETGNYRLCLFEQNFVATTSNIVLHRRVYETIGGMRPLRFVHDWDFLLRACKEFQPAELKKPMMQYRTHGNNTIASGRQQMIYEILMILALHYHDYRSLLMEQRNNLSAAEADTVMHNSINAHGNDALFSDLLLDAEVSSKRYFKQNPNSLDKECTRLIEGVIA